MIKNLTKLFAITALIKKLIETKVSKSEGVTQLHPVKIPGRTVFIREKEYLIRENYIEEKTPIIFLHSWGSDSLGSWFKILPAIKKKSSFIAIDLRNHGKSDSSWKRWNVEENADIVISILKTLNINKCHLVGWSMGSAVALAVAKKEKTLVDKLVLITPFSWLGGAVYKDKTPFKLFISFIRIRERLFPNLNPQSKFSYLMKSSSINDEYSEWAWNNLHKSKDDFIYADGGRFVVPYDAREWINQIENKCLVITGGKDRLVPEETSNEVVTRLKNVITKNFSDAGHSIPWTHDKELLDELSNFLEL
ncbi:MAG: alpha/beta hydrolase [Actinomycetota bacterium]|nr:alpha/beta hydrolase [Actinomycetota bacterium]MDA3013051.1 alpha/beta hydrolase [Actinomycetota bacterium]